MVSEFFMHEEANLVAGHRLPSLRDAFRVPPTANFRDLFLRLAPTANFGELRMIVDGNESGANGDGVEVVDEEANVVAERGR